MKEKELTKRIKYFTVYSILSGIAILFLLFMHFYDAHKSCLERPALVSLDSIKAKFVVAERIDIIEKDDKLAISLSNSEHTPLPRFDNMKLNGASNRNSPNIIFFDGKGDEVGGINFDNGGGDGTFDAIRHLAFDGYKQDEVVTLSHFVRDGKSNTGLYIYERPEINIITALTEMGVESDDNTETLGEKIETFQKILPERFEEIWGTYRRVAVQTNTFNDSEILLADGEGRPRLRLAVSKNGESFIEFLDEKGEVTNTISGEQH